MKLGSQKASAQLTTNVKDSKKSSKKTNVVDPEKTHTIVGPVPIDTVDNSLKL